MEEATMIITGVVEGEDMEEAAALEEVIFKAP